MTRFCSNERGMALAIAIIALVVVGMLVGGSFYLGTEEQRAGENQGLHAQTLGIAEGGAPEVLQSWNADSFNGMRLFPADTYALGPRAAPGGTGSYGGALWKLTHNLYLIEVTATSEQGGFGGADLRRRGSGARQRVVSLVRVRPPAIPSKAALTTQGDITMGGHAAIDGRDQTPNSSWTSCAAPDTTRVGIVTTVGATVTLSNHATIVGNPPVLQDPTIDSTTFTQFGDLSWDFLVSRATVVLPAGTYTTAPVVDGAGQCDATVLTNWGDGMNRAAPCGDQFRIIHVTGDLKVTGTQGQGILLVDGNLEVLGQFEWFGVIIVKGALKTAGSGASPGLWGVVLARNADLVDNTLHGKGTLNFSKCAVTEALQMSGDGALVGSRSFVALN